MPSTLTGHLATARLEVRRQALRAVAGDASLGFGDLVRAMTGYCSSVEASTAALLSKRLHRLRPDLFEHEGDAGRLWRAGGLGTVPDVCTAAAPNAFLVPAEEAAFPRHELLPRTANAHRSSELPSTLSRRLHTAHCPSLEMVSGAGVSLFCSPEGFQVFNPADGSFARSGTSRPLSTAVAGVPALTIDRPLVLVQDIFIGANFAHFLFDWVIRVMALAAGGAIEAKDCIFVMGGFAGPFQQIVMRALCSELALDEDSFLFPEDEVVLRSRSATIWFSDTTTANAHPAQMFRPEATGWIRRLGRAVLPTPPAQTRRLYISRADAGRRMVANEAAILPLLERHGFETVLLGHLPVADQIGLMASATHVVGAHGMGMTHLAFNPGTPSLVELFNPADGTDAYAFMAKGLGFGYAALMGERSGDTDFTVEPGVLQPTLAGGPPLTPTEMVRRTWLPGQRFAPGMQTIAAVRETRPNGASVLRHVRDGVTGDSNVGWWELRNLEPGAPYTGRCYVLIGSDSLVGHVTLHFGGAGNAECSARLSIRGTWQPLVVTGMCDPETLAASLVLRMNGAAGCSVLTSGWAVTGPMPAGDGRRVVATMELEGAHSPA